MLQGRRELILGPVRWTVEGFTKRKVKHKKASFELVEITRIEIHGPAEELEKLKEPFAPLNPTWWDYQCGLTA